MSNKNFLLWVLEINDVNLKSHSTEGTDDEHPKNSIADFFP